MSARSAQNARSARPRPRRRAATSPRTTARDLLLEAESEAGFQQWVTQLATLRGWRVYHTYDSRRNAPGLPDLLMVRERRLVFAELKRQRGRLRPEQREWLAALILVGGNVETYLWRPADRAVIETILS